MIDASVDAVHSKPPEPRSGHVVLDPGQLPLHQGVETIEKSVDGPTIERLVPARPAEGVPATCLGGEASLTRLLVWTSTPTKRKQMQSHENQEFNNHVAVHVTIGINARGGSPVVETKPIALDSPAAANERLLNP